MSPGATVNSVAAADSGATVNSRATVSAATATGDRPRLIARGLLAIVDFYRGVISPLRPPSCRYLPTCSEYAVVAIQTYGAGRGSWMALRRLLRCHPFHAGGHDPVPLRVDSANVSSLTTTRTAA